MTTIADLAFRADTSDLDKAQKKLTDLGTAGAKATKSPLKFKADTTALGTANRDFSLLSRNALSAQSSVNGLGRSFDVFRALSGPLGDVAVKIGGMVGSLGAGVGTGLASSLKAIANSFVSIKTSAAPANAALEETKETSADADSTLLKLGATYLALKGGKDLLAAADARANLAAALSVAWSKKVIEAKAAEVIAINSVAAAETRAAALDAARPAGKKGFNASKGRAGLPAAYAEASAAIHARVDAQLARSRVQIEAHAAASSASWLRAKPLILGAVGSIATGVGLASAAFIANALAVRASADDNAEFAAKLGVTTTRLETLKVVANENSGSVEGLQKVYDKLSKSLNKLDEDNEKTEHAFAVLGLSMKELAGLSESEVAGKIIKNYNLLGQSTKATAAVSQLLGPAFREQLPALQKMGEGIQDVEDRIIKYGAVADAELVKKGGEQEIAITNLGLAWQGLSIEIARWGGEMIQSFVTWAASALNSMRGVLTRMREVREEATKTEAIPQAERNALFEQAKTETYGDIRTGAAPTRPGQNVGERFKALLAQRRKENDAFLTEETRFANRARAAEEDALRAKTKDVKTPDKDAEAAAKKAIEDRAKAAAENEKWRTEQYIKQFKLKMDAEEEADQYATKKEQDDKEAARRAQEDNSRSIEQLGEKADALRAQLEPNSAIITQLQLINALETGNKLTATEAAKLRLEYQAQMVGEQATFAIGWENAFNQFTQNATTAAQDAAMMFNTFTQASTDAIVKFAMTGSKSFSEFGQSIMQMMVQIAARRAVLGLVSLIGGAFGGGAAAAPDAYTNMYTVPRAGGGPTEAGKSYLVGEQGPELLRMGSMSGHVYPSEALGGGSTISQVVNISVTGGQTNEETGQVVSKAVVDTFKSIVRGEMIAQKRPGGLMYQGG
jgi:lambda family phage tail tape measure protein